MNSRSGHQGLMAELAAAPRPVGDASNPISANGARVLEHQSGRPYAGFRSRSDARGGRYKASTLRKRRMVATSVATQALRPGTTGRLWMKWVPHLSSHNGPGRVQLEGFGPTRNRKVVGSNPTSGSKAQVRALQCSLCLSTVNDCVDPPTQIDSSTRCASSSSDTTPTGRAEPGGRLVQARCRPASPSRRGRPASVRPSAHRGPVALVADVGEADQLHREPFVRHPVDFRRTRVLRAGARPDGGSRADSCCGQF